jgi:hypothetical protein
MANPTSNFGWQMPTNTDLVKDLPADFEVFGQAVDTSLMDLKGGTTGQVLSKASNTDMDFTWVAQDDSNAIQNAIVDAKGDLISATAADTPARLASSGVNGDVLTVDTTTATGLKWAASSSGSMTLISSTSLSGTLVTLSSIPGTYQDLYILLYGITNTNNNRAPRILPNGSATITDYAADLNANGTNGASSYLPPTAEEQTARTNANNSYVIQIHNYASTAAFKPFSVSGRFLSSTNTTTCSIVGGAVVTTSAITSLGIDVGGVETMNSGTVVLYGVK